MNPSEREFHLGLHTRELHNLETSGLACGVTHQCGLSDARLTVYHESFAVAAPDPR
jgi:hypothetical protein